MTAQSLQRLSAFWLRRAAQDFANHCCNELPKEINGLGITKAEKEVFASGYEHWNSGGKEETKSWDRIPDFALMNYLAYLLDGKNE